MISSGRQQLFDRWSRDYDAWVLRADAGFPFEGYEHVLKTVLDRAEVRSGMTVLDLGTGTGNVASGFLDAGCAVWGTDFSAEMMAQTQRKYPDLHVVHQDLLGEWPEALNRPFDRVVSAYVFHEFDLETKVRLLRRIFEQALAPDGCVLVADVSFPTERHREEAHQRWKEQWDEEESYWAADETLEAVRSEGWTMDYEQVAPFSGLYVFSR